MGGLRRWEGVPRSVLFVVAGTVVVFAYGTGVHLAQLIVGGGDPYPSLPGWLAAYFGSLTVLDPVAGLLLGFRRLGGLMLAIFVLVTDALANAYANYVIDGAEGVTAGRVGQGVITALAVTLVVATPRLTPWLHRP